MYEKVLQKPIIEVIIRRVGGGEKSAGRSERPGGRIPARRPRSPSVPRRTGCSGPIGPLRDVFQDQLQETPSPTATAPIATPSVHFMPCSSPRSYAMSALVARWPYSPSGQLTRSSTLAIPAPPFPVVRRPDPPGSPPGTRLHRPFKPHPPRPGGYQRAAERKQG